MRRGVPLVLIVAANFPLRRICRSFGRTPLRTQSPGRLRPDGAPNPSQGLMESGRSRSCPARPAHIRGLHRPASCLVTPGARSDPRDDASPCFTTYERARPHEHSARLGTLHPLSSSFQLGDYQRGPGRRGDPLGSEFTGPAGTSHLASLRAPLQPGHRCRLLGPGGARDLVSLVRDPG
jgi:hypothetical protein